MCSLKNTYACKNFYNIWSGLEGWKYEEDLILNNIVWWKATVQVLLQMCSLLHIKIFLTLQHSRRIFRLEYCSHFENCFIFPSRNAALLRYTATQTITAYQTILILTALTQRSHFVMWEWRTEDESSKKQTYLIYKVSRNSSSVTTTICLIVT
jgi:hypothetical protein